MDPSVEVVLLGLAALVALMAARSRASGSAPQPIPVRADQERDQARLS